MSLKRVVCALVLVVQSFALLPLISRPTANGQIRRPGGVRAPRMGSTMADGLQIRLSEGAEQAERGVRIAPAVARALTESDTRNLLSRLQPIKADAEDEKDFALRDRSLPPPRTGKTIQASFPPPDRSDVPDLASTAPLELLRYSPEGDVPLAPQLSVTFSQPMVAVTSHDDSIAGGVPVKLRPEPPGKWRWVGTRTLVFDPDVRFPMATEYTVEVSRAAKSATGASLAAAKTWKFVTPPPQVKSSYPTDGTQRRDTLMYVEFDQRVDPAAVLQTIHVRAGRTESKARLATREEIDADPNISLLASKAEKDRWLVFRAVDPLPADSTVTVAVGPGTPSSEGPRKTTSEQTFAFRTFGPLRVTRHECGYQQSCSPFDQWSISFSNSLDLEAFDKSQVRVDPEVPGLKTEVYGSNLVMRGVKKGRTAYRVTLDSTIRDQFGQTLGAPASLIFNVKSAPPALASSGDQFIVLDPAAPPRFSVYSVNHDRLNVRLYSVGPEHFGRYIDSLGSVGTSEQWMPPGRLVVSETVAVTAQPDEMAETRINLARALNGGLGNVIVVVEPTTPSKNSWENRPVMSWAQSTRIGLDAFVDGSTLIGWATSLKDGKPLGGVQMSIEVSQAGRLESYANSLTQTDGLARFALVGSLPHGSQLLVARTGNDVALLPQNSYQGMRGGGWIKSDLRDALSWFVFDDRKMYRPGEEVHVKGWIRRIGRGKEGDVGPLGDAASGVAYTVKDSRGNDVLKGNAAINALGGFDTAFKLPPTMNLGYAAIRFSAEGGTGEGLSREYQHQLQVQEFRRPEFEVTAQASEGPHFVGEKAEATMMAAYYAGGGLPDAEVNWTVMTTPAQFTPPNRDDFTFGKWIPWWIPYNQRDDRRAESFAGRTDAAGKHRLRIDFVSADPPRPWTVTATASVTDVNRQEWAASTSMLVHPADLYVGIRSPRTFVQKGQPLVVQSIVTDLDGKAIAGREIRMRAVLMDWVFEKGEWKQKEINPQDCVVRSAADQVECRFEAKEGGMYRVTASIIDNRERRNESELTLWVAGGKVVPKRNVEQEDCNLIPERKDYQPGDTAEILVQAPFYPAEAVMTLRRSGIVKSERFTMDGPSYTLRVPIGEGYIPNVYVQVDLVGEAVRTDDEGKPNERAPKRPAFARGSLNLLVPPLARKLSVEATPREKTLEPGGETLVDVEVRDAAGKPVAGSELAVVVVDEAILGLTGYRIGDPISTFYSERSP
ncbi:MAG TPA: Ig-like domain-containing protein, partial [Blastocatellia bacterium]|nr:Ig-like domain-containing protein [Blastocatellia bacterium]